MKTLLLILCMLYILPTRGQEPKMSLSLHQDVRLLFIGDDHGNNAFTPDLILRFDILLFKLKKSSFRFSLGTEYADLSSNTFHRFFIGAGYITKFSFLEKFAFGLYIDHGLILRGKQDISNPNTVDDSSFTGLSLSFQTTYPITKRILVSLLFQVTDRKDLSSRYGSNSNNMGSGYIGLKFPF